MAMKCLEVTVVITQAEYDSLIAVVKLAQTNRNRAEKEIACSGNAGVTIHDDMKEAERQAKMAASKVRAIRWGNITRLFNKILGYYNDANPDKRSLFNQAGQAFGRPEEQGQPINTLEAQVDSDKAETGKVLSGSDDVPPEQEEGLCTACGNADSKCICDGGPYHV